MKERASVLDELYVGISTTERVRHADEPPPELNDGYVKLLFAYGFGRLGDAARAMEIEAAGRALLDAHRVDPIHAWLIDVFEIRIRGSELPAPLRARLDAFERVTRYKVDRSREASWIVAGEPVDAIRGFARNGRADDLATTTASYAALVERGLALANSATEEGMADAAIEMSLQVRPQSVAPEVAARVLDRVLPRVERMTGRQGLAYARAIALAVHAAPERVSGLVEQVAPYLASEPWELDLTLALLVDSLAANHRAELAALWQRVPESARSQPRYRLGLLRLGAPPDIEALRRGPAPRAWPAELREATLDAILARPFQDRFAEPWALELFAGTTDDFGTNSHFTYRVIRLVDRIIRGVLDE